MLTSNGTGWTFVALLFLNVDPDPNTVMPSAASAGMVILPP
jgi:hypothetical protein